MATQTPSAPAKKPAPAAQPPEESSWRRYSPHGEMPLSGAGSLAAHVLVIGVSVLLGLFVFSKKDKPDVPVTAVKFTGDHGGGGGPGGPGGPGGSGDGIEESPANPTDPKPPEEFQLPALGPEQIKALPPAIADDPSVRAFAKLDPAARDKFYKDLKASGRDKLSYGGPPGGPGKPGGSGPGGTGPGGTGPGGTGPGGNGPGGAGGSEDRFAIGAWTLNFDKTNPRVYLSQLQGIGARVGIPNELGGWEENRRYKVISKLTSRPAPFDAKDATGQEFRLYNKDPLWVVLISKELGLSKVPDHFAVSMPQKFINELANEEVKYRGLAQEKIQHTEFALKPIRGGFEPKVISQTPK